MPVTIKPSDNIARAKTDLAGELSAESLLERSCPREYKRCNEIIQSSFQDLPSQGVTIASANNGLFEACRQAYSNHHHLSIRPDDVWFSILTQLSFFINAHAEELRSFFVAHEGKKELEVVGVGTIYSADFGRLAVQMTREIEKNVVDPDLRDWIMPDYSTTTHDDTVTAAILMMGSLQAYFSYKISLTCGIPSVTLLGERQDWEKIRRRLDMLARLGKEPGQFGAVLKPVLDSFLQSFDEPNSPATVDFWSKILHHHSNFSGPSYYTGWLNSFCFWDADGKPLLYKRRNPPALQGRSVLDISDILNYTVQTDDVPCAHVSVPVTVDDNGRPYKTRMVAGVVGIQWLSSGGPVEERPQTRQEDEQAALILDSVQPLSGWWMYEILDAAEAEEEKGVDLMEERIYGYDADGKFFNHKKPQLPKNERKAGITPFWNRPRIEVGVGA